MKFTNGFWLVREGVSLFKGIQVQKIDATASTADALVATRRIEHRGQTLNIGTMNVALSSPAPDVIRVKVAHHLGGIEPLKFEITEQATAPKVSVTDGELIFTSGQLTATLPERGDFNLSFSANGKQITSQTDKGIFYAHAPEGKFVGVQLPLGVGEQIYGLGERFTPFIKNGQSLEVYNEDPGTSSDQAYKNLPFYISNKGYGVLVNHTGRVSFEIGSETVNRVQFSVESEEVEYIFIYGPSTKEILEKYTALTGRPKLPPAWSFGLWLSTSFVTDYDEKSVSVFIDEMSKRDIPLSVFHFDCFWMREYQWCDFTWDDRVFPDPVGMLKRLHDKGLRVSLWINPYIGQASPLFKEGKEHGYLLKRADGSVWQWDLWQAGLGVVDFTNPGAREWFKSKLRPLLEMGVDCFKTDFGERIPTDVVYFDVSNPEQMHNLYTQLYNETVYEVLNEKSEKDALVFARSATVGGQKLPVHWGGDNTSNFESMAESLRGGLSLGLGGFGFWSHDIGGFEGTPNPAVFKRWVAFGALSSHSRLHGNESVRVPWAVDEEAVDVTRKFIKLKAKLMPYLYATAIEATKRGLPMMRPMFVEFPEDRNTWNLDEQYMLGDSILVAPIMNADGIKEVYLPKGTWTNLLTGEEVEGDGWRTEQHGFDSLPLYVRPNTLLALGTVDDNFEYDFKTQVEPRAFGLGEGQTATTLVYNNQSHEPIQLTATNQNGKITIG
ncbi:MAG: alpha-xylosidase [Micrococcales bacterium]